MGATVRFDGGEAWFSATMLEAVVAVLLDPKRVQESKTCAPTRRCCRRSGCCHMRGSGTPEREVAVGEVDTAALEWVVGRGLERGRGKGRS